MSAVPDLSRLGKKKVTRRRFPLALPTKKCIIEEIRDRAVKTLRLYEYASSATACSSHAASSPSRCPRAAGCPRCSPSGCPCAARSGCLPSGRPGSPAGPRCSGAARCTRSPASCSACASRTAHARRYPPGGSRCSSELEISDDRAPGSAYRSFPSRRARCSCDAASCAYHGVGC